MAKSDNNLKAALDNVKSKNKNTIKIINKLQSERLGEIVSLLEQIKAEIADIKEILNNGENGK